MSLNTLNQTQTSSANLNFLPVDIHGPHSEIHSDGVLLSLWENPWFEILNHAGLPHVRVSDQDDLKQEVKIVIMLKSQGLHGGGTAESSVDVNVCSHSSTVDHLRCLDFEGFIFVWIKADSKGKENESKMHLCWEVSYNKTLLVVKATVGHQARVPAAG